MSVQTVSVCTGPRCNASCQFCIANQTGHKSDSRQDQLNRRNLETVCRMCGTAEPPTLLITGKGEPTGYPKQITEYLEFFQGRAFAPIELQTNGLATGWLVTEQDSRGDLDFGHLRQWRELGLDTIAISTVGIHHRANSWVYHQDYPDLAANIRYLRGFGFTVRLCVMMLHGDGCVDSPEALEEVMEFCRTHDVGQLTFRPIKAAYAPKSGRTAKFVREHGLSDEESNRIFGHVADNATLLYRLMHGMAVFDWNGQNVCAASCLTSDTEGPVGQHRSLIFERNGNVYTSWDHPEGSIVLQGDSNYG